MTIIIFNVVKILVWSKINWLSIETVYVFWSVSIKYMQTEGASFCWVRRVHRLPNAVLNLIGPLWNTPSSCHHRALWSGRIHWLWRCSDYGAGFKSRPNPIAIYLVFDNDLFYKCRCGEMLRVPAGLLSELQIWNHAFIVEVWYLARHRVEHVDVGKCLVNICWSCFNCECSKGRTCTRRYPAIAQT